MTDFNCKVGSVRSSDNDFCEGKICNPEPIIGCAIEKCRDCDRQR